MGIAFGVAFLLILGTCYQCFRNAGLMDKVATLEMKLSEKNVSKVVLAEEGENSDNKENKVIIKPVFPMYAVAQPVVVISENGEKPELTPVIAAESAAQVITILPG